MSALGNYGPLAAAINGEASIFQNYKSGIFFDTNQCTYGLNHAVLIVGQGIEENDT